MRLPGEGRGAEAKEWQPHLSRVENHLKDMKAITRLKGAAAMATALSLHTEVLQASCSEGLQGLVSRHAGNCLQKNWDGQGYAPFVC